MLGGCLFSTRYTMTAEVWKKIRVPSTSGQIKYSWTLDTSVGEAGVIDCIVMPFISNSYTRQSTGESFSSKYATTEFLKLTSKYNIPRSAQITNIRHKGTDELVYRDLDFVNGPATWYNTPGSAPRIDPFGRVAEYETLLSRAEEQGDV